MPLYEYECQDCGKQIEVIQKISDAPLTICENCGGLLEKMLSVTSFCLKGNGWYKDAYSGKSNIKPQKTNPKKDTKSVSANN